MIICGILAACMVVFLCGLSKDAKYFKSYCIAWEYRKMDKQHQYILELMREGAYGDNIIYIYPEAADILLQIKKCL